MWIAIQITIFIALIFGAVILPRGVYSIGVVGLYIITFVQIFVPWLAIIQFIIITIGSGIGFSILSSRNEWINSQRKTKLTDKEIFNKEANNTLMFIFMLFIMVCIGIGVTCLGVLGLVYFFLAIAGFWLVIILLLLGYTIIIAPIIDSIQNIEEDKAVFPLLCVLFTVIIIMGIGYKLGIWLQ